MTWTIRISRGATFRVPVTVTDSPGAPITFTDSELVITPTVIAGADPIDPIELNPGNGKLELTSDFTWRENWNVATSYAEDDVVKYVVDDVSDLWIALQTGTGKTPGAAGSELYWAPFAQFLFLLEDSETATYAWKGGTYKWTRTYGNGDTKFKTGLVEVTG